MISFKSAIFTAISPASRLANKINWRFGRKYRFQDSYHAIISNKIKPGMIVLSHKNYEFTNLFIKGYWTHAAVIVSNSEIVEALSSGVMQNEVKDFFSTSDDFIILEPINMDNRSRDEAINFIKNKVGSPYNFSFIQSEDKFTCSDLVGRAYKIPIPESEEDASESFSFISYLTSDVLRPEQVLQQNGMWKVVVDTTRCNDDVVLD